MNKNPDAQRSQQFHIILAKPDWEPTQIIVADALVNGSDVKIHPREGQHIEDEAGLCQTVLEGSDKFQAKGMPFSDAVPTTAARPSHVEPTVNSWRYLIALAVKPEQKESPTKERRA